MKRSFIREILEHTGEGVISFAGGLPDERLFPLEALRETAAKALEDPRTLQYTPSAGYAPLREAIARSYRRRGFPTDADEILITSGSQQALDILCRTLGPGSIGVESPSYLGALRLFALHGIAAEKLPLGEEGVEIGALDRSLARTRLAYLIPDFHNPAALRYSESRRSDASERFRPPHRRRTLRGALV